MALLQSSDNHIFENYLGNDIVNIDQLFVRSTQDTVSTRLEESKLSPCSQDLLMSTTIHAQPTMERRENRGDFPSTQYSKSYKCSFIKIRGRAHNPLEIHSWPSTIVNTRNSSTQKAEAGGSGIQGEPGILIKTLYAMKKE